MFLFSDQAQDLLNESIRNGDLVSVEIKNSTLTIYLKSGERLEIDASDGGEMFFNKYS